MLSKILISSTCVVFHKFNKRSIGYFCAPWCGVVSCKIPVAFMFWASFMQSLNALKYHLIDVFEVLGCSISAMVCSISSSLNGSYSCFRWFVASFLARACLHNVYVSRSRCCCLRFFNKNNYCPKGNKITQAAHVYTIAIGVSYLRCS